MAHKIIIGIDNGVTGTIGWVGDGCTAGPSMIKTPVKSEQSYTKAKKNITRVDFIQVQQLLDTLTNHLTFRSDALVVIERPMVNPMRFTASCSALRALESTLIAIETLGLARMYVDSRDWQKVLLPKGCQGPELKDASEDIGCRLFPECEKIIRKHGDADSLLIAEWARRAGL